MPHDSVGSRVVATPSGGGSGVGDEDGSEADDVLVMLV